MRQSKSVYLALVRPLLGLVIAPALMAPPLMAANKTDWGNLKQLTPGQELKVVQTDGKSYEGKFQSVSDGALVIHSGSGEQTFTPEGVKRVSIKRRTHRGRNALIGGAIGAGAGLGIGVAIDRCQPSDFICSGNRGKAIATPLFGLIGAGIGALVSKGGWQEIYHSP
jgi:hypothetical protein